jgi:hypothetical protein
MEIDRLKGAMSNGKRLIGLVLGALGIGFHRSVYT